MRTFTEQIRGMFFLCKFGVRVVYKSRPRENSLVLKEEELPKQQQDQNEKVKMPKDKKKEAERQRGIRLRKKKETEKLEAFWSYALEKILKFVEEFLVVHEQNSSSKIRENHKDQETNQVTKEQETKEQEQETPQGIEVQETPQQSLGETLTNNEGYYDPILDFLNDSNLDFLNDPDLDFLFDPNLPLLDDPFGNFE